MICHWCGQSEAEVFKPGGPFGQYYFVKCFWCGSRTPPADTAEKAKRCWDHTTVAPEGQVAQEDNLGVVLTVTKKGRG